MAITRRRGGFRRIWSPSLYAAPTAASVWIRVVEKVSDAVAEVEITSNLPAATQLLSPRNYMKPGSTAAAAAYDCAGVYLETDF